VTSDLYAVTFANGLFVAVGAGGVIASSPDGKTWTDRTPTVSVGGDLNTVVYGGGLFLAEGVGAAVSTDGMNWSAATLPPNPITGSYDVITESVKALAYGPLGFVAGGSASGYDVRRHVPPASATFSFTSQDGQSWQNPGIFVPASPFLISLAQAGGALVGIGADSSAYFSQDSIHWLQMELPSNFMLAQSYAANVVCYGGGHFVIAGADLDGNASVATRPPLVCAGALYHPRKRRRDRDRAQPLRQYGHSGLRVGDHRRAERRRGAKRVALFDRS
jgi:hypothetical protein